MDLLAYIDRTEPSSPSSTPTTIPSEAPPRSRAQLKELGRTVYKQVWDEFYDWEPGYCSEILGTATQSIAASKRQIARIATASVARLRDNAALQAGQRMDPDGPAAAVSVSVSVTYVDVVASGPGQRSVYQRTTVVKVPVVAFDAPYAPFPLYESCPPISRSVLHLDHEDDLPFLPYADDERFQSIKFQARFDHLVWGTPLDPDVEMIQIETVRRLHAMHKVSTADTDRMEMFKPYRKPSKEGLLWDLSQRDILHWPGAFRFKITLEEELCTIHTPDPDNLRERLENSLGVFCPSINCFHAVCETHGNFHANSYIPSRKPQLTGLSMTLSEGEPCGSECFRHIQDVERFMDSIPPSPIEHQTSSFDTLETVLGIAPDLIPCQLAVICLRSCKQVFVQRLQLFPDSTILSPGSLDLSDHSPDKGFERSLDYIQQRKSTKLRFSDNIPTNSEITSACAHSGPCTSSNCCCYAAKHHCTSMCRCDVKCERQWKSCNCANGRCIDDSCSCFKNSRECTPGKCASCNARGKNITYEAFLSESYYLGSTGRPPCPNTKMQHSVSKPIEIKCGKHGWGAFAMQNMKRNTFLGSYVGHIITSYMADSRTEISKYFHLNYLFEVCPDQGDKHLPVFDAAYLGNATRFLNHDEKDGNVEAKVMLVNGEHQIKFFTKRKVKKGRELFIDYGDKYWKNQ